MSRWEDPAWWTTTIDTAIDRGDPVVSNVRITLAHRKLSLALRSVTGPHSGANFHTWAVWGSKKAGRTIRQQDVPWLPALSVVVGAALGATGSRALPGRPSRKSRLTAAATTAAAVRTLIGVILIRTARQIFTGNVTVLDDIGRQTARFVCAFADPAARTEDNLERWLSPLRRGSPEIGGQDLLREAYRHYFTAAISPAGDRRDELMLTANLLAILHEHHRLDPYIGAAMPRAVRSVVTRHLLTFSLGTEVLRVSRDVTSIGTNAFPGTLRSIELPELRDLLDGPAGLDRTPNSLLGSGARDWSDLADRMNFIADLFRTRQFDDNLFAMPFSATEAGLLIHHHPTLASMLAP